MDAEREAVSEWGSLLQWTESQGVAGWPTEVLGCLCLGVLIAAVGVLRDRDTALPARLFGLVICGLVALVALDRHEIAVQTEAPRLVVATTAAAESPALTARLQTLAAQSAQEGRSTPLLLRAAAGEAGNEELSRAALAAARVHAAQPRTDAAFVWTGPFEVQESGSDDRDTREVWSKGRQPGMPVRTLSTAPPLGFDPAALQVVTTALPRVDQPTALELRFAPTRAAGPAADPERSTDLQLPDLELEIELDEDGSVYATDGAALRDRRSVVLDAAWRPAAAGPLAVQLRGEFADGRRITARGRIDVLPAQDPLLVIGRGASWFVTALAEQGLAAAAVADWDSVDGARFGAAPAFVLLEPPPPEQIEDLIRQVDLGAGLVLVGGARGAVPVADSALAAWSPLWLPEAPNPADAAVGTGGPAGDDGENVAPSEAETPADPADPPPADPDDNPAGEPGDATPPGSDAPPPDRGAEPRERPEGPPGSDALAGDTTAARNAPVVEDAEVLRRQVALLLVIDTSGSMNTQLQGGVSRIDLVRTAAARIASSLRPDDLLGVIGFDDSARELLPLASVPDRATVRRIFEANLGAAGQTNVMAGMKLAERRITACDAPIRHVVLLTDGEDFDPGWLPGAKTAARAMARDGAALSLIHVTTNRLVADVADIVDPRFGNGRYIKAVDARQIPTLMFAEVRRMLGAARRRPGGPEAGGGSAGAATGDGPAAEDSASGDSAAEDSATANAVAADSAGSAQAGADAPDSEASTADEPATEPAEPDSAPMEGDPESGPEPGPDGGESEREAVEEPSLEVLALSPTSPLLAPWVEQGFPALGAVDAALADERATLLLAVSDGTPLLALANRGLGRVLAWATDPVGPGARLWREDARFPAWLATWTRSVMPSAAVGGAEGLESSRVPAAGIGVLDHHRVVPAAPTPAEAEAMRSLGGGARTAPALAESVDELQLPAVRQHRVAESRIADDAWWVLAGLLLLALVERLRR